MGYFPKPWPHHETLWMDFVLTKWLYSNFILQCWLNRYYIQKQWEPQEAEGKVGHSSCSQISSSNTSSWTDKRHAESWGSFVVKRLSWKTRTWQYLFSPNIFYNVGYQYQVEKTKQDDALSDLSNILGDLKGMAVDMGSEMDRSISFFLLCSKFSSWSFPKNSCSSLANTYLEVTPYYIPNNFIEIFCFSFVIIFLYPLIFFYMHFH